MFAQSCTAIALDISRATAVARAGNRIDANFVA